ncbi:MAG: elongation factor G [Polyangiales bacterium]
METKNHRAPRVAALVGPSMSGKTSLLEALLLASGALPKKGNARERSTVGDLATEAKARGVGAELAVATADPEGEHWTFLDCPGSSEFAAETFHALRVADVAVVVVDADPARASAVAPTLAWLDANKVPHVVFINKVDQPGAAARLRETLSALQGLSARPLVMRELPLRDGQDVVGFVDLVSERAYGYKGHEDAQLAKLPDEALPEEQEARRALLEHLADFDDHLLTELLEDVAPPAEEVYANLRDDLKADLLVDVFFGSAEQDHGVRRLLKALRHEAPEPHETATRLGVPAGAGALVQSFKTVHAPHVGKLSFARVWRGEVEDGMALGGGRVSGVHRLFGVKQTRAAKAVAGEVVALGHLDALRTGHAVDADGAVELIAAEEPQPVVALALRPTRPGDDVKLSGALAKLAEESPGLRVEPSAEAHELVLWGQGERHLRLALDRLKARFGLDVLAGPPAVAYRETVARAASAHGRFKHQSGGHGAFGDVELDVVPLARGEGFAFDETVTGGAVPRQYFASVEKGAREYFKQGPLGFPVVDVKVVLRHGSYHAVDSSDAAFQQATRVALLEALPKAGPVLLEPVATLRLTAPSEHTPRVQRLVTARRGGHLLGYDQDPAVKGWDVVEAQLPQAEMRELATELRTATQGAGTFTWSFSFLREVDAKESERVVALRRKSLADARG